MTDSLSNSPDLTMDQARQIDDCRERLVTALPGPTTKFDSLGEAHMITYEDAKRILRYQRRLTLFHLIQQETHEHMGDDCGDYLMAATECWYDVFNHYFNTDGSEEAFTSCMRAWLSMPVREWGACDGDIRFTLFSDDYQERGYA